MSAYIVDNSTIDNIVAGLKAATESDWTGPYPKQTTEALKVYDHNAAEFGEMLRQMNEEAVRARYPEGDLPGQYDENDKLVQYKYRRTPAPSPFVFIKALGCFLYQCAEGDVPTHNDLYKALDRFQSDFALHIVQRLPQYEAAPWG